jgi:putative endonuclease
MKNKTASSLKKSSPNIQLGRWGENVAFQYLIDQGCSTMERNVRTPDGEIDIVARAGDELIFVEVKTRRSTVHSYPEESVSEEKLEHLESAAGWYLLRHPEYEDNWRLDVISVIGFPGGASPRIDWFDHVSG